MAAIRAVIPPALEGDRWYAGEMRQALDLLRSGAVVDAVESAVGAPGVGRSSAMIDRVVIDPVRPGDGPALVAANLASIALHEPWVYPCRDAGELSRLLHQLQTGAARRASSPASVTEAGSSASSMSARSFAARCRAPISAITAWRRTRAAG